MEATEWVRKFSAQIAAGINQARGDRSDQWIADRTKRLGHPISRPAVSEYRRGVRKVMPVTDLMVLAMALEVPPVALLFPGLPNAEVLLFPDNMGATAFDSLRWFTGEVDHPPTGREIVVDLATTEPVGDAVKLDYKTGEQHPGPTPNSREYQLLQACRQLADEYDQANRLVGELERAGGPGGNGQFELFAKWITDSKQRRDQIEERIRALGGDLTVPETKLYDDDNDEGHGDR